jgi:hypothetical protein
MEINFVSTSPDLTLPKPIPASKKIPDWYKKIPRFINNKKQPDLISNQSTGTIKTCMPVLDAMTTGYLILSENDVFISKNQNNTEGTYFQWTGGVPITFHSKDQVTGYPMPKSRTVEEGLPKFHCSWIVQTPKNYSCLFVTPLHHDLPFTIFPGVVDTDSYFNPVNFPFLLDPSFEGLIPKGTPVAQVIPFKRENWKMKTDRLEDNPKLDKKNRISKSTLFGEFWDRYKRHFWVKKEYN